MHILERLSENKEIRSIEGCDPRLGMHEEVHPGFRNACHGELVWRLGTIR